MSCLRHATGVREHFQEADMQVFVRRQFERLQRIMFLWRPQNRAVFQQLKSLTRESCANKVEIRQQGGVNFCCVCKVTLSFGIIHSPICGVCVFIYFTMADTFKSADPFETGAEAADPCEHIKKSDSHNASDRLSLFFFPFHLTFP